jgi:hypothetical protein
MAVPGAPYDIAIAGMRDDPGIPDPFDFEIRFKTQSPAFDGCRPGIVDCGHPQEGTSPVPGFLHGYLGGDRTVLTETA